MQICKVIPARTASLSRPAGRVCKSEEKLPVNTQASLTVHRDSLWQSCPVLRKGGSRHWPTPQNRRPEPSSEMDLSAPRSNSGTFSLPWGSHMWVTHLLTLLEHSFILQPTRTDLTSDLQGQWRVVSGHHPSRRPFKTASHVEKQLRLSTLFLGT